MNNTSLPKRGDPFFVTLNNEESVYPLDLINLYPSYDSTLEKTSDLKNLSLDKSFNILPQHHSPLQPLASSEETSSLDKWLFDSSASEMSSSTQTNQDWFKRTRGVEDDDINACWKSPLCPNRKEDGGKPDHCNGECADSLFANPPEMPDQDFVSSIMEKSKPKVSIQTERQSRLKRSEMESTPDVTGRAGSMSSSIIQRDSPPLKKESSRRSPRQISSSSPQTFELDEPMSASTNSPPEAEQKPHSRVPHKQVEKKYRENINAQLDALRRAIPISKQLSGSTENPDVEDLPMNSRQPSKALVLSSATMYIKQLEQENEKLKEQIDGLREQNKTLQSLVKCDDCSLMNYARNWNVRGAL